MIELIIINDELIFRRPDGSLALSLTVGLVVNVEDDVCDLVPSILALPRDLRPTQV